MAEMNAEPRKKLLRRDGYGDDGFDCEAMDPSLWQNMPKHVIERVVAFLPILALLRFRSVCRAWRNLPFLRQNFRSLRETLIHEAWVLLLPCLPREKRGCLAFLPAEMRWRLAALPSLLFCINDPSISFCTGAGGLFCFRHVGFASRHARIWVCNPLTRQWKRLPPFNYILSAKDCSRGLVGMVMVAGEGNPPSAAQHNPSSHYKMIARTLTRDYSKFMTEEYDSQTNQWRVTAVAAVPHDRNMVQALYCDGTMYFVSSKPAVYAYTLQTEEWTYIPNPGDHVFTNIHLVECCSQVLMVGHLVWEKHEQGYIFTKGIKVWRLRCSSSDTLPGKKSPSWTMVCCMPRCYEGVYHYCTSICNLIYLMNDTTLLVCDVVQNTWREMPATVPLSERYHFISFMPTLQGF